MTGSDQAAAATARAPVQCPQVRLDPRTRSRGRVLLAPTGRLLRLGADGQRAVVDAQRGRRPALARRLVEAGAAYPVARPLGTGRGTDGGTDDLTVVVPVRDRVPELDRCLSAFEGHDVLVVDDGSLDPAAVAAVCARHGARLVTRANGGPAAARNTALPLLSRPFVAFVDSDTVVPPGVLGLLRSHLEDAVAVAPRVVGGPRSPLDLGPHPGAVGGTVAYVPTACLLVRREALTPFDESLRYGEDVDLVWRLVDGGGTVRYDPDVVVQHSEPARWRDRLVRRFRYGTSAAPLSARHPGRMTHLVLPPWPTAVLALLLVRRPVLAAAALGVHATRVDRQVRDPALSVTVAAANVRATGLGVGRALGLLGPLAWSWGLRDRRVAALLLAPWLAEWAERRTLGPARYVGTALVDQAAYGAGVVVGCVTSRTAAPLRPRTR